MIKFFRKIRYDLLEKNKTGKYLKYAIGEIILVVIGILIALQINNWNEFKKDQKFERQTLIDLGQEFSINQEVFKAHLNTKKETKLNLSIYLKLLINNQATFSEYSYMWYNKGFSANTYNPSQGVINSLINSGSLNKISNKNLRYKLSKWNDLLVDYLQDEILYLEFRIKSVDVFEKTRMPFAGNPEYEHSEKELNFMNNNLINTIEHGNSITGSIEYLDMIIEEGEILFSEFQKIIKLVDLEIEK